MTDESVVETDDVRVTKSFDAEHFPVPAVTFEVDSERDDDVTVRIVDEIPEEFGIDQIGFHPEYGSEYWTATGDGIVRFERTVEAGESFTTVYGVRMSEGEESDPFLSTPLLEVGESLDDLVPPESTQVVRDLVTGERESVPGLDETEVPEYEDDEIIEAPTGPATSAAAVGSGIADLEAEHAAETAEAEEGEIDVEATDELAAEADAESSPVDEAEEGAVSEAEPGAVDDATGSTAVPEPADLVGALADAIRAGDAADEDLAVIRDELGVPEQPAPSTDVKLDHLQSRVSDIEAYADALEAFIDENGTAEELLASLESTVSETTDHLADVDGRVDTLEAENEALRANVEAVEETLDSLDDLSENLDRLAGDLDALDERVADVEDVGLDLEALEGDVETVRDDIAEIEQWRSQLSNVLGA